MSTTSTPVQKGWDNHFAAFGAQDVEKILEDYTEDSQVMVWDTSKNEKSVFKGISKIKLLFEGLFKNLSDISALAAPLIEVEEDPGNMVFLVWECPSSKGYTKVTDTFIFKGDKILRQNIVVFNNV